MSSACKNIIESHSLQYRPVMLFLFLLLSCSYLCRLLHCRKTAKGYLTARSTVGGFFKQMSLTTHSPHAAHSTQHTINLVSHLITPHHPTLHTTSHRFTKHLNIISHSRPSHYTISHHVMSHSITWHNMISQHVTSHRTKSHHNTAHQITLYHITHPCKPHAVLIFVFFVFTFYDT